MLIPSLCVKNSPAAILFYQKAFNAKVILELKNLDGTISHADLQIGDDIFSVSEEDPKYNKSVPTLGGSPIVLNLMVENVDESFAQAISAGAVQIYPLADQFYGYRSGRVEDPYGFQWIISKKIKDIPQDEMQKQMDEWSKTQV